MAKNDGLVEMKIPAYRLGLPGHAVASKMRANEISFLTVPLAPAHKAGLVVHFPVKIRWQSKKLQIQGAQILRNEAYLQYAAMMKDASQCSPSILLGAVSVSSSPSALLRAKSPSTFLRTVSPSTLLRTVSLSNGSWTFYEDIKDAKEITD